MKTRIRESISRAVRGIGKTFVAAVALAFAGGTAYADDTWLDTISGITWSYKIEAGKATITGIDVDSSFLDIPSTLGGKTVAAIDDRAISGFSGVHYVGIRDGVERIGNEAFSDCPNLEGVTFYGTPKVESIGDYAFSGCTSLKTIGIPDSVTTIGDGAFSGCAALETFSFTPSSKLESIGDGAFAECRMLYVGLSSFPDGFKSLGDNAFLNCENLGSVSFPDSLESIGAEAFKGCTGLYSVIFPYSAELMNTVATRKVFDGCQESLKPQYRQIADGLEWRFVVGDGKATVTRLENNVAGGVTVPATLGGYPVTGITGAFSYLSNITSVTLPDTVTFIGEESFYSCASLTTVNIPDGVTSIGYGAFNNCPVLTAPAIPDGVTSIGRAAFFRCNAMADADGFVIVRDTLYYYCGVESAVTVPDGVAHVSDMAFNDSDLTEVTMPEGLKSIGRSAFISRTKLEKVTAGRGLESIGAYAFRGCSKLSDLTLPDDVKDVGMAAFLECPLLADENGFVIRYGILFNYYGTATALAIPEGVTRIDYEAFYDNDTIVAVTIPSGVTSIGTMAFQDCGALASVTIPDSVDNIASSAFQDCDSLVGITTPHSVTNIGTYAFRGCDSLASAVVKCAYAEIAYGAFSDCKNLADVTLPAGTIGIDTYVFYGDTALATVHVKAGETDSVRANIAASGFDTIGLVFMEDVGEPFTVSFVNGKAVPPEIKFVDPGTAIGYLPTPERKGYIFRGWFTAAEGGELVTPEYIVDFDLIVYARWLPEDCEVWEDSAGVEWIYRIVDDEAEIYNDDEAAIPHSTEGVVTVPSVLGGYPVTRIGDWAFEYCESITGVVIPDSVVSFGEDVFECCSSLRTVEIPATVTEFGDETFTECTSLVEVTLPNGLTAIEDEMFYMCESLETLTIPSTVTRIGYGAFQGCASLQIADIPAAVTVIDESAYEGCTSLSSLVFNGEIEEIGDYAFQNCEELKFVTIPGSVTSFGNGAFSDCVAMRWADIEEGVTSIGQYAFQNCESLESVYFPETLEEIGYMAFSGCTSLEIVTIPDGVADMWEYAFQGCTSLTHLILSSGISSLPFGTFAQCTSLRYVYVPGNVEEIYDSAFAECTALEEVEFESGVESIDSEAFNGCTALATLTIPKSVTYIGPDAFFDAPLAVVNVEKGDAARVKTLLEDSGYDTSGIEFVESTYDTWTDGDGVTWTYCIVDDEAWIDNEGEVAISGKTDGEITVPSEIEGFPVTTIGAYAFEDCAALTKVNIPGSVTSVDTTAFLGCDGLADDDGFVIVRNKLCYYAGSEAAVVVPEGVTTVGRLSLGNNAALQEVVLPVTVTTISPRAFYNSAALETVTIPSSVTKIGRQAFNGTALAVVHVETGATASVKSMLEDSELDTSGIEFVEDLSFGCTVTFAAMGGTVSPESVVLEPGSVVGTLPEPTRPGYVFMGWLTADGTEVTADTVVDSDVTFYAAWEKKTLYWHTSRAEALADAKLTGKMVFLICGRDTCANTQATKNESCAAPSVVDVLDRKCTLWYSNCDTQYDENGRYMTGLGEFDLPLVCVIDPDDPEHYTYRSTGYLTAAQILAILADVPEPTPPFCTVTFDANGGTGGGTVKAAVGESIGTLPAASREGYFFLGWFTASGEKISPDTKVMADVTFYAHWIDKNDPAAFWYDYIDESDVVEPYAVPKAAKVYGAVFDGNDVLGIVELKLGKVNAKKLTSKVAGSVVGVDGKKYSIKGVPIDSIDGKTPKTVELAVKNLGTMTLTIGGGKFAGTLGEWHVQSVDVGGAWTTPATTGIEDADLSMFTGNVLTGFLPVDEPIAVSGGKWGFAKAAKVKWAKLKAGVEPLVKDAASGKGLIVDTSKGCTNLSGIKLTYSAKKGTFKGKFKVYELQGSGASTKLKKYNAKVTGVVVGGQGFGEASCKKPAFVWPLTVK